MFIKWYINGTSLHFSVLWGKSVYNILCNTMIKYRIIWNIWLNIYDGDACIFGWDTIYIKTLLKDVNYIYPHLLLLPCKGDRNVKLQQILLAGWFFSIVCCACVLASLFLGCINIIVSCVMGEPGRAAGYVE